MCRLILAAAVMISLGCATPFMAANPETQIWEEPSQGTETVAYVGDPILVAGKAEQKRAIIVPAALSTGAYVLAAGEYLITGMREDGIYRAPLQRSHTKASTANSILSRVLTGKEPNVPTVLQWKARPDQDPQLCLDSSCIRNPQATLEWIDVESFERRLIFSGRSGDVIRAEYREFQNDMARPAFSTELVFDLGRSHVIGVKGSRIQILGLSNQAIKFRVLNSFTDEEKIGRKKRRRIVSAPAAPAN